MSSCLSCKKVISRELEVKCDTHLEQDLTVDGNSYLNNLIVDGNSYLNDLIVNGESHLNEIDAKHLCLKDQLVPPPCNETKAEGCLWVADPNAAPVTPVDDALNTVGASITSNVATLSFAVSPISLGYYVGQQVQVVNFGSTGPGYDWVLNGIFTLTAVTATSISYTVIIPPSSNLVATSNGVVSKYVNKNQLHYQDSACRDYIVETKATDPFHGWWLQINKGSGTDNQALLFIDTTKNPITAQLYYGTVDNLRDVVTLATPNAETSLITFVKIIPTPVEGSTLQRVITSATDSRPRYFTLQSDNKTIVAGRVYDFLNPHFIYKKLDKDPVIRPFLGTDSLCFPGTSSDSDPNNPVFMFDEFCNYQLTQQPMTNINVGYKQYPGYLTFKGTQHKLKTTGITYESNIIKVQRNVKAQGPSALNTGSSWIATSVQPLQVTLRTAVNLPQSVINVSSTDGFPTSGTVNVTTGAGIQIVNYNSVTGGASASFNGCTGGSGLGATGVAVWPSIYMTVIETDIPHHVNRFSTVTLSGFTGPLSHLNGNHDVLINNNMWRYDLDNDFINPSTRRFQFAIEVDTCIPGITIDAAGYITNYLGTPKATVTIGPITPDSEYKTLMSVQDEFFYNMFRFSTHSSFQYYMQTSGTATVQERQRVIPTFSKLQSGIRNSTVTSRSGVQRETAVGSSICVNGPVNVWGTTSAPLRQELPLNNPYGIVPILASRWDYNISIENYLDKTPGFEPVNLWWRLTGAATNAVQQRAGQFYYGDPTLGQTFEAITWPIYGPTGATGPGGPTNQQYFQLGNSTRNNFNSTVAQKYVIGRINPLYTGGTGATGGNVGYIRLADTSAQDPSSFMSRPELAPKPPAFPIDTTINNPRVLIESEVRIWSVAMNYLLNTLGCKRIILDIRCNGGGAFTPVAISNLIGGDRPCVEPIDALRDTGFSPLLQGATGGIQSYSIYQNIINTNIDTYKNILPSKSDLYYPGTVLKSTIANPNPKVYCLTDSRSASTGDITAHLFLGNNATGPGPTNRELGAGVKCKLLGDVNGILSGFAGTTFNQTRKEKDFIVTNNSGQPFAFNRMVIESLNGMFGKMINEQVSMNGRGPWLKPDNVVPLGPTGLGSPPWNNSYEAVAYPYLGATGFGTLLPRLAGDVRADPNSLPLYPAQPTTDDRLLWRDVWLEQSVHDIIQP